MKTALSLIAVMLVAGLGGLFYGVSQAQTVTEFKVETVSLTEVATLTETVTLTETYTKTEVPPPETRTLTETVTFTPPAQTVTVTKTLIPASTRQELVDFALELINEDRANHGLPPVKLGSNPAAQKHAEEMLENDYLSHWNLAGMKPYMRYTLEGGEGAVFENVAYSGHWSEKFSAKEIIARLEYGMMYEDEEFNWGHRNNILSKWHNKVNIGLAYNDYTLTIVQDFERDYIEWEEPVKYDGGTLSMKGKTALGEPYMISLYYDSPPAPLTREQLLNPPYDKSYSMGEEVGCIIPEGYAAESSYVNASIWKTSPSGEFEITADITPLLSRGDGVYTLVLWAEVNGEYVELTTHSLFIKE
ncbi:MAG: CAP domain-containing protein [Candidatus Hecatellaceae archaeon]